TIIAINGTYFYPGILPTSNNGVQVEFTDLAPATYIIRSSENLCGWSRFDTVTIRPYQFPTLANGQAFQCDVGGFSISAQVQNGIGPFMYEIIGSTPSTPSIITAPQASPVFTINNGNMYSLIRLRVVDACGNASLGDGSILPLALNGIVANNNCLMEPTTLSVDYIYGASYRWYKKQTLDATDSTFLGIANSINIPQVMIGDTGIYVCYLSINNGCIERTYTYNLVGDCYMILPVKLAAFTGRREGKINHLYWKTFTEMNLSHFEIERKLLNGQYISIGRVAANGNSTQLLTYEFKDDRPVLNQNFYRLKMLDIDGRFTYSNIVMIANESGRELFVYPNPARDYINISFAGKENRNYTLKCYDATGRLIAEQKYTATPGNALQLKRTQAMPPGTYLLHIKDEVTGQVYTERIIFL
ncbi:MAG TPA: T9SS type A sorting domain-containing protein, partial [Ferruginibacter sp.]|nr:T9SS type A sorting domain-containing protein [Ferruginibacter sp.]